MADTKVQTVDFSEIEVPKAEAKPAMTPTMVREQLAQLKRAQGTHHAWGPKAISRLKAKAKAAGIQITGL
mgnify:CR=1 FL=1|jgi:hypothetical protein